MLFIDLDDPATLDLATSVFYVLDEGINADAEDTWVERVFDLPESENVTLDIILIPRYVWT